MDKSNYYLIRIIDISFADPISSMNINSKYVVIGTMKGKLTLFDLQNKTKKDLIELSNENISSLTFNGESFYASIGDEEILEYRDKSIVSLTPKRYNIYRNDIEHNKYCQNSYIMMSGCTLLRLNLPQIDESAKELETTKCEYDYKNIQMKETTSGFVEMTTYTIPFDFDGKKFLWVEYHSKKKRMICVMNVPKSSKVWKYELNENFGHISQAKLLKDNRILIVRKMVECEIRRIDQSFSLEESFKNIGDEVISVFVYYYDKNIINTEDIANKVQIHHKAEDYYLKINITNNRPKESEVIIKDETKKRNEEDNFIIFLLDVDGNINQYDNNQITTQFNLNKIQKIPKEHKDKKFFIMGYPYYIKYHDGLFCISSDHGCYIISDKQ